MGNILVGIKRFIKNKNTVTIIAIIASLAILYGAYSYRIQKATEPINVPYATRTLGPRDRITSDAIAMRKIPGSLNGGNVLMSKNAILDKYVSHKAVIPEGSLFYKEMVVELDDLPSTLFEDIPDGNTVFNLSVDMNSTYGNSIFPGNAIDLFIYKDGTIGRFIKGIKVLAVVDSKGDSVFETTDVPKTPANLMFSVPDEYFTLLKLATINGFRIIPVPRNAVYSVQEQETKLVSDQIEQDIWKRSNKEVSGNGKGGTK